MILDACCGGLMMYRGWHKRLGDQFIYIDIRKQEQQDYGKHKVYKGAIPAVKPLIMADMRYLPFRDNVFNMIICDPPHLDISLGAFMAKKYGSWSTAGAVRTMRRANEECKRVRKPNGCLILKIRKKSLPLYETLLSNFTFFLPIEHKSKSNLSNLWIGWYIGVLKKS